MILSIWNYRRFIWQNAWRDLWYRYAGSSMGFLWNVVNPLFQIVLYTIVFSQLMTVQIANISSTFGFAIYLCSGLIPWIGFSETVSRCTNSFIENANYLKKLAIPEQIFVIQNAWSSFLSLLISMALFLSLCVLLGHYPAGPWLALPLILILLQGFAFGIGLFLGVMNAFFRDIGQMITLLLQMWFWATPIAYLDNALPDWFKSAMNINPMYHFVHALHKVIVEKMWPDGSLLFTMICLSFGFPLLGFIVLKKLRTEIRDVL